MDRRVRPDPIGSPLCPVSPRAGHFSSGKGLSKNVQDAACQGQGPGLPRWAPGWQNEGLMTGGSGKGRGDVVEAVPGRNKGRRFPPAPAWQPAAPTPCPPLLLARPVVKDAESRLGDTAEASGNSCGLPRQNTHNQSFSNLH